MVEEANNGIRVYESLEVTLPSVFSLRSVNLSQYQKKVELSSQSQISKSRKKSKQLELAFRILRELEQLELAFQNSSRDRTARVGVPESFESQDSQSWLSGILRELLKLELARVKRVRPPNTRAITLSPIDQLPISTPSEVK